MRLRRVDKDHFKKLTYPHMEFLYNVALKYSGRTYDAEDLVQETMYTAYRKFHQLRDEAKCRAWLFTILRSHFLKEQRQVVKRPFLDDGSGYLQYVVDEDEKSLAKKYDEKVDSEEIQKALNVLPEKFKSPLILYYMEDMTYQEISTYLDLPIGTVMSRLARAKKHLKKEMLRVAKGLSLGRKVGQLASMLLIGGEHGL
jgi:RNA polymerase sigma-70 factor (ECF subfamily)